MLTVPAWLWLCKASGFMLFMLPLLYVYLAVLACYLGVCFSFVLFPVGFSHEVSADLADVVVASTAHLVHSELSYLDGLLAV